ncbi:MAG: trigger factor [Alphaproteobacteria bacterium]
MKIEELKKTKDLDVEWKVTIPAPEINSELDKKYLEIQKDIKIPGFRQGKVPLNIIKDRYSKNVLPEVTDKVINKNLTKAILEKKLKPAVQPKVDIDKYEEGGDMSLNVSFQLMPEISDIDIKSFTVEKSKLKITEEDIKNSLEDISKKHERFTPLTKKRKSILGDLVLFDYVGKIKDKEFSGGSGKDETVVLGSNKYIPGYEDQMVGLNINDKKAVKVKFPDDYRTKELAGKDAVFDIKIKDIQERVKKVPIDDKLAIEVGEKNLNELKNKIREKMQNDFQTLSNLKMRREASEILLKSSKFNIPSKMIDSEFNFLKSNSNDKKFDEKNTKKLAERRVKLGLIINSIAEKNNIVVEESDLTKAVANEASRYPGQEKQVVEFYKQNPNLMQNLRGVAMEEKVMLYVVNSCKKKDKECTIEELFKSDFLKEENEQIKQNKGDK